MTNIKLCVELVSAHNLMPRYGEGSASSFVELHFENQKFRSTVKEKDLNPVWNESFYFNITDPTNLQNLTLDANVYNDNKATHSKSFLGRVRLNGTSFVPYSDAVVLHYPLEKRSMFSHVKGELGLKVYVTDDPSIRSSNPLPEFESFLNADSRASQSQAEQQASNPAPNPFSNDKADSRHTSPNLPKEHHHHHHSTTSVPQQLLYYSADVMKAEPQQPKIVRMHSPASSQPFDYALNETSSFLGGGQIVGKPAMMSNLKLGVELVCAHNIMPKDEEGFTSSFVELHFDNQKFCSSVKEKDQNPVWNESFYFNITDPTNLHNLTLDAYVCINNKATQSRSFPGRVHFNGTSFFLYSDAVLVHHPLEKHGIFLQGELGLKVYLTNDPSIRSSNPLPKFESFLSTFSSASQSQAAQQVSNPFSNDKSESRHTFCHSTTSVPQQLLNYSADVMKAEPQQPKIGRMHFPSSSQPFDYALNETSPFLGGGQIVGKPAMMSNLKLGVELVSAHNLMPKDGEGSASSFVELHFENQKFRSTVKEKDLNPVWNESFYFNITDLTNLQNLTLDANVYNNNKATHSKSFLGRVRLNGTSFVPYSEAVALHYPLEKRGMFSRVKGELGLRVYVTDDPSIRSSNPLPVFESFLNTEAFRDAWHTESLASPFSQMNKAESRHTFPHLPEKIK